MKSLLIGKLNHIISGDKKFEEQVERESRYFDSKIEPKNLDPNSAKNVLYASKREFENLCVILETNGIKDPKRMTLIEFFTALNHFKKAKSNSKPKTR